jgi:hypothetical protein
LPSFNLSNVAGFSVFLASSASQLLQHHHLHLKISGGCGEILEKRAELVRILPSPKSSSSVQNLSAILFPTEKDENAAAVGGERSAI